MSGLRHTVQLPDRETIDVRSFRFPTTPRTPSIIRHSDWTPGSGFDGITLYTPTTLPKRSQRGKRKVSSRGSGSGLEVRPTPADADNDPCGTCPTWHHARTARRLFNAGGFDETGGEAPQTQDEIMRSSNAIRAEQDDDNLEQHFSQGIPHRHDENAEGATLQEYTQDRPDSHRIGRALAEDLNESRFSQKESSMTTELPSPASVADLLPEGSPPGTNEDRPHLDNGEGVVHHHGLHGLASFPYRAYLHPPSSALQDAISQPTTMKGSNSISMSYADIPFPYYAYLHPPSSGSRETAAYEAELSHEDSEEETEATGSCQGNAHEATWNGFQSDQILNEDGSPQGPQASDEDGESMLDDLEDQECSEMPPSSQAHVITRQRYAENWPKRQSADFTITNSSIENSGQPMPLLCVFRFFCAIYAPSIHSRSNDPFYPSRIHLQRRYQHNTQQALLTADPNPLHSSPTPPLPGSNHRRHTLQRDPNHRRPKPYLPRPSAPAFPSPKP